MHSREDSFGHHHHHVTAVLNNKDVIQYVSYTSIASRAGTSCCCASLDLAVVNHISRGNLVAMGNHFSPCASRHSPIFFVRPQRLSPPPAPHQKLRQLSYEYLGRTRYLQHQTCFFLVPQHRLARRLLVDKWNTRRSFPSRQSDTILRYTHWPLCRSPGGSHHPPCRLVELTG